MEQTTKGLTDLIDGYIEDLFLQYREVISFTTKDSIFAHYIFYAAYLGEGEAPVPVTTMTVKSHKAGGFFIILNEEGYEFNEVNFWKFLLIGVAVDKIDIAIPPEKRKHYRQVTND